MTVPGTKPLTNRSQNVMAACRHVGALIARPCAASIWIEAAPGTRHLGWREVIAGKSLPLPLSPPPSAVRRLFRRPPYCGRTATENLK